MQVLCGATAAAQVANVLAVVMLAGGLDESGGFLVGHAAVAPLSQPSSAAPDEAGGELHLAHTQLPR